MYSVHELQMMLKQAQSEQGNNLTNAKQAAGAVRGGNAMDMAGCNQDSPQCLMTDHETRVRRLGYEAEEAEQRASKTRRIQGILKNRPEILEIIEVLQSGMI